LLIADCRAQLEIGNLKLEIDRGAPALHQNWKGILVDHFSALNLSATLPVLQPNRCTKTGKALWGVHRKL
jgi:hypothetical protein